MHGVKLAQKMSESSGTLKNNQLVSAGNNVIALDIDTGAVRIFNESNWSSGGTATGSPIVKK